MTYQGLLSTIANNIRHYRKQNGWSQMQLAEKLDVHLNTISNIERTRQAPSLFLIQQFASLFSISENELLKT